MKDDGVATRLRSERRRQFHAQARRDVTLA